MQTLRQMMREYLRGGPRSIRDISQELRISEREALMHLEHIERGSKGGRVPGKADRGEKGAGGGPERLVMVPAACGSCGYEFTKRKRLGKPGRCPVCRSSHVSGPLYRLSGP